MSNMAANLSRQSLVPGQRRQEETGVLNISVFSDYRRQVSK